MRKRDSVHKKNYSIDVRTTATVPISVAVDMRTLLDRNNLSSRTNGQVAARRMTGLIIKRL